MFHDQWGRRLPVVFRDKKTGGSVDVSETNGVRSLHLGNDTIQSAMRVQAPYRLELVYTRAVMCFLLFHESVSRVLMIGLGGGSLAKFIWHELPHTQSVVVELDPRVIDVAHRHFMVPEWEDRLRIIAANGVDYIREQTELQDIVILDAYAQDGLPEELSSLEFYSNCLSILAQGGVLVVNLWGSSPRFTIFLQRIIQVCKGNVLLLPSANPGNVIIFAFIEKPDLRWVKLATRARLLETQYEVEFLKFLTAMRDTPLIRGKI